jgi:hypothetical protein
VEPFLSRIEEVARTVPRSSSADFELASSLASVLFKVILARTILGLKPCHDQQILLIAYQGIYPALPHSKIKWSAMDLMLLRAEFKREPTSHEQAYASSIPYLGLATLDNRQFSTFQIGYLRLRSSNEVQDPTYDDFPILPVLRQGTIHHFVDSDDAGLTGGKPVPLPKELWSKGTTPKPGADRPRPRPRPKLKTTASTPNEDVNLPSTTTFRVIKLPQEPTPADEPTIRVPATRKQKGRAGNQTQVYERRVTRSSVKGNIPST